MLWFPHITPTSICLRHAGQQPIHHLRMHLVRNPTPADSRRVALPVIRPDLLLTLTKAQHDSVQCRSLLLHSGPHLGMAGLDLVLACGFVYRPKPNSGLDAADVNKDSVVPLRINICLRLLRPVA